MRIFVTGGAGFIGSHFVKTVLHHAPDAFVLTYDKLTYAGRLVNLAELPAEARKRHVFVKGDICDRDTVRRLLQEYAIDTIVHFAAESHVDLSLTSRVFNFITTNVTGTHVLLECALQRQVQRFVHISTDEVYGSLDDGAMADESTPLAPRNPYAASKAAADLLCLAYFHTHQLPLIISRGSNTYGSHQHPEKFLARCIRCAMEGTPMPVYGTGENLRQWLHVQDHCQGVLTVLTNGRPGHIYNIGGANIRTNLDMARRIFELFNADPSLLTFVEDRKGHDWRYAMECRKIREELQWRPEISLDDGLRMTIDWYARHRAWIDDAGTE